MNKDLAEQAAVIITELADRLEANMEEKSALRAHIETLEAALRKILSLDDILMCRYAQEIARAALASEQDE